MWDGIGINTALRLRPESLPTGQGIPGAKWVLALDMLWDLETPEFSKWAAPSLLPESAWASSLSQ